MIIWNAFFSTGYCDRDNFYNYLNKKLEKNGEQKLTEIA